MKNFLYYILITHDSKQDRETLEYLMERFEARLTRNSELFYRCLHPVTPYKYFYIDSKSNAIGCCNECTIDYRRHSHDYIVKEIICTKINKHLKVGIPVSKLTIF